MDSTLEHQFLRRYANARGCELRINGPVNGVLVEPDGNEREVIVEPCRCAPRCRGNRRWHATEIIRAKYIRKRTAA